MIDSQAKSAVREAVGVFDRPELLQEAIDELLSSGFNRAELSLLASETAVREKLGDVYLKVSSLEDNTSAPRSAYVSTQAVGDAEGAVIGGLMYIGAGVLMGPAAFAGGSLAAIASAAAIGGGIGGVIGSIFAGLIGEAHANRIAEQLDHGGLLLWVRVWNTAREKKAMEILSRHSAHNVHVHEFA